jgi:hypothetical protein
MVIDGYLVQYTFFNQSFEITIKSYPIAGCRHLSGNIRCRKSYIAVLQNIDDRYDHKNLYLDVSDFADLNPSAENIAIKIWNILREQIDSKFELSVVLYETDRNFVEYDGE